MNDFYFKLQGPREQDTSIKELELDFVGLTSELCAALCLAAKDNPEIRKAVISASEHLRDEHRFKECQTKTIILN